MKLLGVDYGRRRIGLAVTDETGSAVRSLPTLDRRKHLDVFVPLERVIAEHQPGKIIIGLPLDTQNNETEMSREIRSFAAGLAARVHLPVEFTDESHSSQKAQLLLRCRKKKIRRQKDAVDRIAACLILEQYQRDSQ